MRRVAQRQLDHTLETPAEENRPWRHWRSDLVKGPSRGRQGPADLSPGSPTASLMTSRVPGRRAWATTAQGAPKSCKAVSRL